jgi:hypothetical protein
MVSRGVDSKEDIGLLITRFESHLYWWNIRNVRCLTRCRRLFHGASSDSEGWIWRWHPYIYLCIVVERVHHNVNLEYQETALEHSRTWQKAMKLRSTGLLWCHWRVGITRALSGSARVATAWKCRGCDKVCIYVKCCRCDAYILYPYVYKHTCRWSSCAPSTPRRLRAL